MNAQEQIARLKEERNALRREVDDLRDQLREEQRARARDRQEMLSWAAASVDALPARLAAIANPPPIVINATDAILSNLIAAKEKP